MKKKNKEFGQKMRKLREAKGISLRSFADRVDLSPTFISKVERGEFAPPTEERIKAIARELDEDVDDLLALADKVPSDLNQIIRENPREMADFLRTAKGLSAGELRKITERLKKGK